MTNPTATYLDTFTNEERALAQAIPSVYVTQLAVARCLLRLERLERKAEFATMAKAAGETLETSILAVPAISKVAASLPAEPAPQHPQCVGEQCTLCLGPASHKVAEEPLYDQQYKFAQHPLTAYVCSKHFAAIMGMCGKPEEPQRPRGVEVGGELASDDLWARFEQEQREHGSTKAYRQHAEQERDHYRDAKRLGDQREASLLDDVAELTRERDALKSTVAMQAGRWQALQTDNARLQGELARMREQAARLDEVSDKAHEELYAVKLERDAANARADRMVAVVAVARNARWQVPGLDEALATLDATEPPAPPPATSPVVEPGGKVT